MPSIRLVEATKRFGRITAVDRVNLEIGNKEYVCILGPTGSGKTTLLKLIAGLVPPDEGEIFIGSRLMNNVPPEERDAVYVPQHYALFPHMTVLENVSFGPLVRRRGLDEVLDTAHKMLDMVKLDHRADAYPKELSGGMEQRVALARGLASGGKLLLLDEPLGALDARLRVKLRYELKSLARRLELTIVHVTHDQREAMSVADRIIVLRRGRIGQIGTPFHIYKRPATLFIANFVGETNFLEGIVAERDVEGSTIELRGGLRIRVRETTYLKGERIIIAVRQELLTLKPFDWGGVNALRGKVKAVHFLRESVKYEIQLLNGDVISSKTPISRAKVLRTAGEKLTATFNPTDSIAYSRPPLGLAKAIEVA